MIDYCKDCGHVLPAHQPQCPAQPYPSLKIEQQIEPPPTPRERYQAQRELEGFVRGERK